MRAAIPFALVLAASCGTSSLEYRESPHWPAPEAVARPPRTEPAQLAEGDFPYKLARENEALSLEEVASLDTSRRTGTISKLKLRYTIDMPVRYFETADIVRVIKPGQDICGKRNCKTEWSMGTGFHPIFMIATMGSGGCEKADADCTTSEFHDSTTSFPFLQVHRYLRSPSGDFVTCSAHVSLPVKVDEARVTATEDFMRRVCGSMQLSTL